MHDWLAEVLHAWRRLRRAPAFTVFSVLTLALGIGATTAIYSVVYAAILRPPDIPNVHEVANLYHSDPRGAGGASSISFSRPDFEDYRSAQTSFEFVAPWKRFRLPFSANGSTDFLMGEAVGGEYFSVVAIHAALGRVIQRTDDRPAAPRVMVLSDALWRTRFGGDSSIVGRTVTLAGDTFEIVGVAPPAFRGVDMPTILPTAAWIPLSAAPGTAPGELTDREHRTVLAKGRLKAGRTMEQARSELMSIGNRLDAAYPIGGSAGPRLRATSSNARHWFLMPAANIKMHESVDRLARPLAATIMVSVCLVLLVACTNVANLMLARSTARRHETAVRFALGATRWRIVREHLTEAALVTFMGGAAAAVLAQALIVGVLNSEVPVMAGLSVRIAPEMNMPVAAAAIASTVLALIVFGFIPALHGSRGSVREAIASDGQTGSLPRWRGRRGLIACQVTVSAGLVSIAVLCAQQVIIVARHETGLDIDRLALVRLSLPPSRYDEGQARRLLDQVLDSARQLPRVESAALSSGFPIEMGSSRVGDVATTQEQLTGSRYDFMIGTPGVFRTWGIPTVEGRTFDDRDTAGAEPVAVLTQRLARHLFPEGSPVGHQIVLRNQPSAGEPAPPVQTTTVVGVVADTDFGDRGNRGGGSLYLPWTQHYRQTMTVTVRTADNPAAVVDSLKRLVNRIDPDVPIMDAEAAASLGGATNLVVKVGAVATGLLGGLALILAMAGLYGVLSEVVVRRTRELGIRMALGADSHRLRRMVLVDGVRPVVAGLGLGLGFGAILRVAFRPLFIRMLPAFDPIIFVVVPTAFIAAALIAAYLPARHACRVDPNVALRHL
jgi:predicted permease